MDAISRGISTNDVLCYSTTSGTTGKPKIIQFRNKFGGEYPVFPNDPRGPCDIWKIFGLLGVGGTFRFLKRKNNLGITANFVSHILYAGITYMCGKRRLNMTILDQLDHEVARFLIPNKIFFLMRIFGVNYFYFSTP